MWNEPKASMDPVKETIVYIKRRRICEWRKSSFLCEGRFLNKVRGSLGWNDMKFSVGKKHDYRVKKRSLLLYIHYLQGFIHPRWCRISSINQIPFESMKSMDPAVKHHPFVKTLQSHSTSPRVNLTWRWVQCHERKCSRCRDGCIGGSSQDL